MYVRTAANSARAKYARNNFCVRVLCFPLSRARTSRSNWKRSPIRSPRAKGADRPTPTALLNRRANSRYDEEWGIALIQGCGEMARDQPWCDDMGGGSGVVEMVKLRDREKKNRKAKQ